HHSLTFGGLPATSVTPVSDVMLNGICMPGVVPAVFGRVPVRVTVRTVVVPESQAQVAWLFAAVPAAEHWMVAVDPSWSWIPIVPVCPPFIFSLKVTV